MFPPVKRESSGLQPRVDVARTDGYQPVAGLYDQGTVGCEIDRDTFTGVPCDPSSERCRRSDVVTSTPIIGSSGKTFS